MTTSANNQLGRMWLVWIATAILALAGSCSSGGNFGAGVERTADKDRNGGDAEADQDANGNGDKDLDAQAAGEGDGDDGTDGEFNDDLNPSSELQSRGDEDASEFDPDTGVLGCKFPKDVRNLAIEGVSLGLLGWGGTSKPVGQAQVFNLDVRECDWFESTRASGNGFMLVYNPDKEQSYTEPYTSSGGRRADSDCQRAASLVSSQLKTAGKPGQVECSKLPPE